jgi:hypothetical protein
VSLEDFFEGRRKEKSAIDFKEGNIKFVKKLLFNSGRTIDKTTSDERVRASFLNWNIDIIG